MTLLYLETPFDMRIHGYTAQLYAYHKIRNYPSCKHMDKSNLIELVTKNKWEIHLIFDHYDSVKPEQCLKMVFVSYYAYLIFLDDLYNKNNEDEVEILFDLLLTNGLISKEGAKK